MTLLAVVWVEGHVSHSEWMHSTTHDGTGVVQHFIEGGWVVEVDMASNQWSVSTREKNECTTWFDVDRRHLFQGWFCSRFNRVAKELWSNFLHNWVWSWALMPCCKKALSVTLSFANLGTHYPTSSLGLSRHLYYAFECARLKVTSGQGSSLMGTTSKVAVVGPPAL